MALIQPIDFIVYFLTISTAIYVTLVVFVQNWKRLCLTLRMVKKLKIKLFKIILCMRFLHPINLKIGFYFIFHKSSSNYNTGV